MKYKGVIFDLDGTILDTLEDLTDAVNFVLRDNKYPEHDIDDVRKFVGNGIHKLIERAVPVGVSLEKIDQIFCDFKAYYNEHCDVKTRPYTGIIKLLQTLKQEEIKIAVLSNKADDAVQILCEKYFTNQFDFVAGEKKGIPRKPNPEALYSMAKDMDLKMSELVYVGDSEVDIMTAQNAGMDCVIVDWGFRERKFLQESGARCIVSTINELLQIIKSKMPDEDELYDLAELFKVFGDSTRIRILFVLFESERCVCDIADILNMTQSAISHQLKILKQSKLVKNRREGKSVIYSLADGHVRTIIAQGREHIEE